MKYLPLYYKWGKLGRLTSNGLCGIFCRYNYKTLEYYEHPEYKDFQLFIPKDAIGYWGAEKETFECYLDFTPLRQNIVLLLAAMNNEL